MNAKKPIDNIENKIMDNILESVFTEYGEDLLEHEFSLDINANKITTSENYNTKKQKLLLTEQKKLKWRLCKKRYLQAVAALAITFVIAGNYNTIVQGWWHKFLNVIIDMNKTHTEINFQEPDDKNSSFNGEDFILHYIPDNFTLNNSYSGENTSFISFDNNNQEYFHFTIRSINQKLSIDTENAEVSNIKFKEGEALYSTNENVNILVWYDDIHSYVLAGNISKDSLVKIGENIELEKNE